MSYAKQAAVIGKRGYIKLGGLEVSIEVLDYKNSYGKDRWLVTPLSGAGEIWVEEVHVGSKKK